VPHRLREALAVPVNANQVWSGDFIVHGLYGGRVFRTLKILDDDSCEAIAIEIDTSLPVKRLIRVFEQLKMSRGLPGKLRVDTVRS
jgi:putative transposase